MKIDLGGGLFITRFDDRNWLLSKTKVKTKGDRAGQAREVEVGWYGSLAQAAKGALDQAVGDSEAASIAELVSQVALAEQRITRACWTIYESSLKVAS